MPDTFELEVTTPERLLIRNQVNEAQIPAANGYLGIGPEHAPLLAELGIGELSYRVGNIRKSLVVAGGFVEVMTDHVRVLADSAEKASEIDVERARAALRRAEERLGSNATVAVDVARALNAAKRAKARLEAAAHR
ncbi:MAG: F0F1 ATP synthase subunit epsilon [Bryobacteraceae bacterium]|nr:F0F1 ATP synthase subunit epsilon [Bryobacterales bacterium]NUN03450.1 F0F1 ATP synthase subunit epsilon [Bryobacteraceae bacterium]